MRNWQRTVVAVWLIAGLTGATPLFGGKAEFKSEWVPEIRVPRVEKAPVIDGAIGEEEWAVSAAFSGVANVADNKLIPRPTTYFFAWDKGHLYLACRTYVRPDYKLRIYSGRAKGLANVFDDGMEFVWKPMGKNVVNRAAAFKFFLNCLGNTGDTSRLTLGQMFKDWNPQFKTAYRLTEPGTAPDGGHWWELEMSCTPEDFELSGEHRAGDEWRMMLGFNMLASGWMQARVPCLGSYFDDSGGGYPRIILVENEPTAKLLMSSLDNLATNGTAELAVAIHNPTATTATVDVDVEVAGDTLTREESLSVPAGGQARLTLSEKLPDHLKSGRLQLKATHGKKVLLSYTAPFEVGYKSQMLAPVKPRDPNEFDFSVAFSPLTHLLLVRGDTWFLPEPDAALSMTWKVFPEGDPDNPLLEKTTEQLALWRLQDFVKMPELAPGSYTVEGLMNLRGGTTIGPMQKTIEKKDEAKVFSAWWNTDYGKAEQLIPPYTALRRTRAGTAQEAPAFACWGREYALSGLGLPTAIRSQNGAVLTGPARLVVRVAGKDVSVPLGAPRVTREEDWRVAFAGASAGAGLQIKAAGWLEQDGLVHVELTYGPEGDKPVTVEGLRIEYPLQEADAECLVCVGPGGNYASKTAMFLPPDKEGQLWSSLVTGRPGSRMVKGNFYPTVWIGNDRRGFLWWGDSDRGWFPENDLPAHEAVRAGGAVVLRNNIIAQPVDLKEPRTIAFSYIATPFRPFPKGWRAVTATEDGTFHVPFRGVRTDSKTGKKVNEGGRQMNWMHPESRYPEEWDALWAEQKSGDPPYTHSADKHTGHYKWWDPYTARNHVSWTHMSFTLYGWGPKTIESDLLDYFGHSWDDEFDESFLDYAMYIFDSAFGKGGVLSTYWDITFPEQTNNVTSGLCYLLENGQVQPGYLGLPARRFYQRLQATGAKYGLYPNLNGGHSTNAYLTVAMPWMDSVLDGERHFNLDVSDRDWVDYYPLERMRSMSSPHNWGVPICWMTRLISDDPDKVRLTDIERMEYLWLHDSWKNPYGAGGRKDMPDTVLDFGLNGDATAYTPYWRNPFVSGMEEGVLVSAWRIADLDDETPLVNPTPERVDRVLLAIFNHDRKHARDITLQVDLEALGLPVDATIEARELYGPENMDNSYYAGGHDSENATNFFSMECRLDQAAGTLVAPRLAPHRIRLIGLSAVHAGPRAALQKQFAEVAEGCEAAPQVVLPALANFGIADPGGTFHRLGAMPHVLPADESVQVAGWVFGDRVLLAVVNTGEKRLPASTIGIDLEALDLVPRLEWQEFVRLRQFSPGAERVSLDYHNRRLQCKGLEPRRVVLVGVCRF